MKKFDPKNKNIRLVRTKDGSIGLLVNYVENHHGNPETQWQVKIGMHYRLYNADELEEVDENELDEA